MIMFYLATFFYNYYIIVWHAFKERVSDARFSTPIFIWENYEQAKKAVLQTFLCLRKYSVAKFEIRLSTTTATRKFSLHNFAWSKGESKSLLYQLKKESKISWHWPFKPLIGICRRPSFLQKVIVFQEIIKTRQWLFSKLELYFLVGAKSDRGWLRNSIQKFGKTRNFDEII